MGERAVDVALFGVTGFTGRLTAEYLLKRAEPGLRVALVGRNREKLLQVQRELGERAMQCEVVVADAGDAAALGQLAQRTRVVCTTVGPYAKYGLPLVEACATYGAHYADLTGEVQFMRDSIDRADAKARASGARIVHTCGFDSIPSDLGVFMVHEAAKAAGLSGEFTRVTLAVDRLKGSVSGGTIASLMVGLDEAKAHRSRRRLMADPYALSPERAAEPDLGRQSDQMSLLYDDFLGQFTAPFVMASVNTRVVRRSNALLGHGYGRAFRYREVMALKKSVRGVMRGAVVTAGLGALMASLMWPPARRLVEKRLPQPGEGPSLESRTSGGFTIRVVAEAEGGRRFVGHVVGVSDPGYNETAKMLSEAVLCLARGEGTERRGVLTPATAFGMTLVERLRTAGMTFRVES